jgi:hypothetical protein
MATPSANMQHPYPFLESTIRIGGIQHEENIKKWQLVLERFSTALKEVSSEGKSSALDRHIKRGQLLGQSSAVEY